MGASRVLKIGGYKTMWTSPHISNLHSCAPQFYPHSPSSLLASSSLSTCTLIIGASAARAYSSVAPLFPSARSVYCSSPQHHARVYAMLAAAIGVIRQSTSSITSWIVYRQAYLVLAASSTGNQRRDVYLSVRKYRRNDNDDV